MVILMILSFLSLWIMVGNNDREPNWRLALVQGAVIWGGYLTLGTEILSLFAIITRLSLILMWSLPILAGTLWIWLWLKAGKVLRLPIIYHRDSWVGLLLDFLVILILIITAVVAFVAPPNSHEAVVFRMSRVAHWEQNQSLRHYPTGIEAQNTRSPGAELIFLNLYLLRGDDAAVNLAAWFSFGGCVAAAASLAEVLGAKKNGQRLAAVFTATLPTAITHATGAMNDIVVAFWIVSTVLMLLHNLKGSKKPLNFILAGVAAGLAVVTKPTALIYLLPFALMMAVILFKKLGLWKMLQWVGIALLLVGLINVGHFFRNGQTYGELYYSGDLDQHFNELRNGRALISNITRNAALHADLPFPPADHWLMANLEILHEQLGLDISDPRTTLEPPFYIPPVNTSEMTSGNPVHAALIVFSVVIVIGMVFLGKEDADVLVYISTIFVSLLLFNYTLKWSSSGSRLQLPFFILFAPIVAVLLDWIKKSKLQTLFAVVLLIYAVPWSFQTEERPVIPSDKRTYHLSVFNENKIKLYFATNPGDYKTYWAVTNEIKGRGINQVGLHLRSTSEEYPLWVLLDQPEIDLHIEWVDTPTPSSQYLSGEFSPEAIICEACPSEIMMQYSIDYEHLAYDRLDLFIKE